MREVRQEASEEMDTASSCQVPHSKHAGFGTGRGPSLLVLHARTVAWQACARTPCVSGRRPGRGALSHLRMSGATASVCLHAFNLY